MRLKEIMPSLNQIHMIIITITTTMTESISFSSSLLEAAILRKIQPG
jgi:hypothetical protein